MEQREVLKESLGILSEVPPGYARIDAMSGQYKVAWLCEALLVSRSGYYDWKERWRQPGPRQAETIDLRARIREEFARSRQTYSSPRLAHVLGCPGRRNRIARLMRAERLFARQRSKYRHATTDSRHGGPIAPHRLQGLAVQLPNQAWTTDDHWDPACPGLALSGRHAGLLPARGRLGHEPVLDAPLTSAAYRQVLAEHGLLASVSRAGNCYDNAFIESFWSSLKYELVYHQRFATRAEALTAIFDYIETFYNRTRLHSSLAYLSPIKFESNLEN